MFLENHNLTIENVAFNLSSLEKYAKISKLQADYKWQIKDFSEYEAFKGPQYFKKGPI